MSVSHDGSSACETLGHLLHADPTDPAMRVCVTCGQRFPVEGEAQGLTPK